MLVSAYSTAIGVALRRFPWEACIRSALNVADEFCIAYDPRFDDPEMFAAIDKRVKPIKVDIDFSVWDWVCLMHTKARQSCIGEWCLFIDMDEILHSKDTAKIISAIQDAQSNGREAVNMPYLTLYQNYVMPKSFLEPGGMRQSITVNADWLYHKTSDYMIEHFDSDIWDGRYIQAGKYDCVAYFDERKNAWFHDALAQTPSQTLPLEGTDSEKIEFLARYNVYIWHYGEFNYSRKMETSRQTAIWRDRAYGRNPEMDIPKLVEMLKEEIVLDADVARVGLRSRIEGYGAVHVDLEHPPVVREWVHSMEIKHEKGRI